jgi:hypothetical protein
VGSTLHGEEQLAIERCFWKESNLLRGYRNRSWECHELICLVMCARCDPPKGWGVGRFCIAARGMGSSFAKRRVIEATFGRYLFRVEGHDLVGDPFVECPTAEIRHGLSIFHY